MIAGCPKCGARYRIDAGKLGPQGARLRCTQCQAVFRVTPPAVAGEASAAPQPSPPEAAPSAAREPMAPPPPTPPPTQPDRPPGAGPTVLVADPDVASGKATANALADWGMNPLLVHDGVEAVLSIQRSLPSMVVLDAALPKMFGFQVCELLKRNEQLRSIQVVLVGAIHAEHRYRRAPSELYGADAYIERQQLPEALRPILAGFEVGAGAAPAPAETPPAASAPEPPPAAPAPLPQIPAPEIPAPTPAPVDAAPAVETPQPTPAAAPAAESEADPAVAAAERLARIVVSDIVLYNPEKFEAGMRDGNVVETLSAELEEGRSLFESRVDSQVREHRDFLADELVRVARSRGTS